MTAPIEDVSKLPGQKLTDQEENTIGEIKEIYAIDGDGYPMWVTVDASFGMGNSRTVFIPLARIKDEDGTLRVPYSKGYIEQTPEVDGSDGISAENDRQLRDHFGIDTGDQEMRKDNDSYATRVPEDGGTAQLADDPDSLETPSADTRDEGTKERLHDPGAAETRDVDAGAIADENAQSSRGARGVGGDDGKRDSGDSDGDGDGDDSKRDSGDSDDSGDDRDRDREKSG